MNKFGLEQEDIKEINSIFNQYNEIKEVIIFGSRVNSTFKTGSDIDLALKGYFDINILYEIRHGLEEETNIPYFFDILDYSKIYNINLKKYIDENGMIFYKK